MTEDLRSSNGGRPSKVPIDKFRVHDLGEADLETASGISLTRAADGDLIDIAVDGSVAAHPHWSTGAFAWWRMRDIITDELFDILNHKNAVSVCARMEFESRPSDNSQIQIVQAFSEFPDRTSSGFLVGGGDFSTASRAVVAGRHLTGITGESVDSGQAAAFNATSFEASRNIGTNQLIAGSVNVIGYPDKYTWNPGVSPWDAVQHSGNTSIYKYFGLGVRAVGTTVATTAQIRMRLFAMILGG